MTRKPDERIQLGDDITITIIKVTGNTVRIGIDAPQHVRIVREEKLNVSDTEIEKACHA